MAKAIRISGKAQPKAARSSGTSLPEKGIALPRSRNVPSKNFHDYVVCIFGEKSVGKTSLCAQFPNALVEQWEKGRLHLPIYQIPQKGEPALTWPRHLKYMDLLLESEFKTVIQDTIDRCYESCILHYCKERGFKHPNDANDYGKTWQESRQYFADSMELFNQAGKRLVFTSHAKLKEITTKTGRVYEMVVPTCSNQAWEYLKEVADFMIYYGYHGSERSFTIRGSDSCAAACGPDNVFLDPDGNQLVEFPAGNSPKEAYDNLLAGFSNKLYGYPVDEEESEDEDDSSESENGKSTTKVSIPKKKGR